MFVSYIKCCAEKNILIIKHSFVSTSQLNYCQRTKHLFVFSQLFQYFANICALVNPIIVDNVCTLGQQVLQQIQKETQSICTNLCRKLNRYYCPISSAGQTTRFLGQFVRFLLQRKQCTSTPQTVHEDLNLDQPSLLKSIYVRFV